LKCSQGIVDRNDISPTDGAIDFSAMIWCILNYTENFSR